jgi:hypothetical protein
VNDENTISCGWIFLPNNIEKQKEAHALADKANHVVRIALNK